MWSRDWLLSTLRRREGALVVAASVLFCRR